MAKGEVLDDPRARTTRYTEKTVSSFIKKNFEFVPTQFIIDENYVGEPPKVQVSFENLNDNIDSKFLGKEISKTISHIRTIEIVRDPKTNRHLGLAKVEFENAEAAEKCVKHYKDKQLMGKVLKVELDVRFANVERKKEEALRPKLPPKPTDPPLKVAQQTFPILNVPNFPLDFEKPTRPNTVSLDERIASLRGVNGRPPLMTPQDYPFQNKNTIAQHPALVPRVGRNYEQTLHPLRPQQPPQPPRPPSQLQPNYEEDEKAWDPPIPDPLEEKPYLSDEQITNEIIPFILDRYLKKELPKNLIDTMRRKLLLNIGYPYVNMAQEACKAERDKIEFEQRRQEQENIIKEKEDSLMRHKNLENLFLNKASDINAASKRPTAVRQRKGDNNTPHGRMPVLENLKRINRSAAAVADDLTEIDRSRLASSSDGSLSPRRSRSRNRSHFGSESRSSSAASSDSLGSSYSSQSSFSSNSLSSSQPSSDHDSTSSRSVSRERSSKFQIEVESSYVSSEPARLVDAKEETAASALLDLQRQSNAIGKTDDSRVQQTAKKRKAKSSGQENRVNKRQKSSQEHESVEEIKSSQPKLIKFPARHRKRIEELENDLTFSEEDVEYIRKIHEHYEDEHSRRHPERTRKPFGSQMANEAHIVLRGSEITKDIKSGNHPKWWNGCSRCSVIEISDKGKVEETVYDDSQKALIKSHVIQAANSTRRDQRNDQRRIATLNPAIDPSFLKQFTSNTLQMRAKNLRFSRSKIHKWGLFACEKIANGDAVIEYVGEKIRPSVADHREKIVYTNLPTHDGSSYFFRVDSDVIDATLKGNKARFINHSCNPNCIAKVIKHENGTNSIVIYAKQTINEDEEITYDYKFPREEDGDKILCRCRAPNCQKYLN